MYVSRYSDKYKCTSVVTVTSISVRWCLDLWSYKLTTCTVGPSLPSDIFVFLFFILEGFVCLFVCLVGWLICLFVYFFVCFSFLFACCWFFYGFCFFFNFFWFISFWSKMEFVWKLSQREPCKHIIYKFSYNCFGLNTSSNKISWICIL